MLKNKISINIVLLIFVVLLIISYCRSLFNVDPLTFSSFLEFLQSVPSIKLTLETIKPITSDWSIFNFLIPIFNTFISVANVAVFFSTCILNILSFFFYVLGVFFALA